MESVHDPRTMPSNSQTQATIGCTSLDKKVPKYSSESKTYDKVENHPKIKIIGIPFAWLKWVQKLPNIVYFILRCIIQLLILCWLMFFWIKTPQLIIIQVWPV